MFAGGDVGWLQCRLPYQICIGVATSSPGAERSCDMIGRKAYPNPRCTPNRYGVYAMESGCTRRRGLK